MATAVRYEEPVVVAGPAIVCGECRHHAPAATTPGFWCKCSGAELYQQAVTPGSAACEDFAGWPEDSPPPALVVPPPHRDAAPWLTVS